MQNKFSRDFVEEYDKRKAKEQAEKETIKDAYKAEWRLKMMNPPPPPRVTIPEITAEKCGMEYPNMRVFAFKVILGSIIVSVAFFGVLYYFSHYQTK